MIYNEIAILAGFYGWPTCAKCNKPVDDLVIYHSPSTREDSITALCHGEREWVTVPAHLLVDLDYQQLQTISLSGLCFLPSQPPETPQLPPVTS